MALSLTDKQKRVLDFLQAFQVENSRAPSQEEVRKHFGFRAISTVQDYLQSLEAKGAIVRHAGRWGGIDVRSQQVPLLGRVAAGQPLEAMIFDEHVEVPASFFKRSGSRLFALRVAGDSMIGEGILPNDLVVIRSQSTARDGEIVVAVVDEAATLKKFFKKQNKIELHSANSKYHPLVYSNRDDVHLVGVFHGLIRTNW